MARLGVAEPLFRDACLGQLRWQGKRDPEALAARLGVDGALRLAWALAKMGCTGTGASGSSEAPDAASSPADGALGLWLLQLIHRTAAPSLLQLPLSQRILALWAVLATLGPAKASAAAATTAAGPLSGADAESLQQLCVSVFRDDRWGAARDWDALRPRLVPSTLEQLLQAVVLLRGRAAGGQGADALGLAALPSWVRDGAGQGAEGGLPAFARPSVFDPLYAAICGALQQLRVPFHLRRYTLDGVAVDVAFPHHRVALLVRNKDVFLSQMRRLGAAPAGSVRTGRSGRDRALSVEDILRETRSASAAAAPATAALETGVEKVLPLAETTAESPGEDAVATEILVARGWRVLHLDYAVWRDLPRDQRLRYLDRVIAGAFDTGRQDLDA
jgi:hypothetical protein